MKTCTRCGEAKPYSEFSPDRRNASGLQARCKKCQRWASRESRLRHPDRVKARVVAWRKANPERLREQQRRWVDANRERLRKRWRDYTPPDPDYAAKMHARKALGNAVRDGRVEKAGACEHCGGLGHNGALHGHHPNYKRPLEVVWLCPVCHKAEHKQLRELMQEAA